MGCLCIRIKRNRVGSENSIRENISAINKITKSKYFSSYCKLKIEFSLINKNKVQKRKHSTPKSGKNQIFDENASCRENLNTENYTENTFLNLNEKSDSLNDQKEEYSKFTLFIELKSFYHFSNRIEYIKELIKRKIEKKKEKNLSDCSESEKSNLNESVDFLNCCICLAKKNEIMLKCSHKFCEQCIKEWFYRNNTKTCPMCREVVNVYEISPGNIDLDQYRWDMIDDKEFIKQKSESFKRLEDLVDEVIQDILL